MAFQSVGRRQAIATTLLGVAGAGYLGRIDKVAAMQPSAESWTRRIKSGKTTSAALLRPPAYGQGDAPPPPSAADRLPLEWNRRQVARLKAMLGQRGIRSFLVRNANSSAYLTGYWHVSTERPQAMFMKADDEAPWYFYPSIDRDLVRSWWYGGGLSYFDYPHADGAFPNLGVVKTGPPVDLFAFMLEGIRTHGIQGNTIGIDGELYPSEAKIAAKLLPGIRFKNISPELRALRMIKTPEELALWSRCYQISDRAHAFARDYLLTYGTDLTDLEVSTATELWLLDELYGGMDLADGAPNHGVASFAVIKCRAGRVTGYAHPNQPYYRKIGRDMPIQLVIVPRLGGCGGEAYRMFLTADAGGRFDPAKEKMWEVSRHSCDIQRDMQKDGAVCADIAAAIFRYQIDEGMQDHIYHRPAHGQNTEGHGPPYIALGDQTVLRENMVMSQEPGLYDPKSGYGFNWSDNIVTGRERGYRISGVPYSREWSLLKL